MLAGLVLERPIDTLPKIDRALRDLSGLVRLWDEAIRIPGLGWRIGLDAIVGLVPGVGDLIGAVVSSYLVVVAARLGVGTPILARMVANVAIDALVGAIPIAGDLFDVGWKANRRNYDLLARWRDHPRSAHRASVGFLVGAGLLALGIAGVLGWIAVAAGSAVVRWLHS